MGDQSGGTSTSKSLVKRVEREWTILPRALAASIPMVGSAISLVIEDQLARRKHERLEEFADTLAAKLEAHEELLNSFSQELFEQAAAEAAEHPEKWKPRAFANLLVYSGEGSDNRLKFLLIEHGSQLTDFDLAIFLDVAASDTATFPSEIRYAIHDLQKNHPEISMLRNIALQKLMQLGFLRRERQSAPLMQVTAIGGIFLEALK